MKLTPLFFFFFFFWHIRQLVMWSLHLRLFSSFFLFFFGLIVYFWFVFLFCIVVACARACPGLALCVYEDHSYSNIFLDRPESLI